MSGCAGGRGPVRVDAPVLTGTAARHCSTLLKSLPGHVDDQRRRSVRGTGYAAAWGDPPIELRCGVRRPRQFDRFATCQEVDGVDWFIPEAQQTGRPVDLTMTAVGRAEYVEVQLPHQYFPPAAAMVDLAAAVKGADPAVRPCRG